jgi:diguanylate cyclase (GGDEF)-like protein
MTPSSRVTAVAAYACVVCALAAVVIGTVGMLGVREASSTARALARDELTTTSLTARLTHAVDVAHASGEQKILSTRSADGPGSQVLYDEQIPAVEATLANLVRIHHDDPPHELAAINELTREWASLRTALNGIRSGTTHQTTAADLAAAYTPLSRRLQALFEVEVADAQRQQSTSASASHRVQWAIGLAVMLSVLGFAVCGVVLSRRLRRIMEPARDQVEFADTLQLAGDESEAHRLLQRHLQRVVSRSTVTVLNRNNSADRLEAVTELPDGSPLMATLGHAVPRSCLAVRSGRSHEEDSRRPALMGCPVCDVCPGASTCAPLTVGGEVIGAVLVNRASVYDATEQSQIRDAVGQAAPVLANMRNLAIAELRAATDSLTGLPNKRAVGDTLQRMLAQASRTLAPLTLLVLDLDHFKSVNDRFGHQVGDQVLANVGAALRAALRQSDFAGRNGGEEFAVMLPDTDTTGAMLTAEKIRAAIADIDIAGVDATVTVSIGLATYPVHATTPDRLERLADSALFVAKRAGRNRIEVAAIVVEPGLAEGAASATVDLVATTSDLSEPGR